MATNRQTALVFLSVGFRLIRAWKWNMAEKSPIRLAPLGEVLTAKSPIEAVDRGQHNHNHKWRPSKRWVSLVGDEWGLDTWLRDRGGVAAAPEHAAALRLLAVQLAAELGGASASSGHLPPLYRFVS